MKLLAIKNANQEKPIKCQTTYAVDSNAMLMPSVVYK